jgi:hypothetical protein
VVIRGNTPSIRADQSKFEAAFDYINLKHPRINQRRAISSKELLGRRYYLYRYISNIKELDILLMGLLMHSILHQSLELKLSFELGAHFTEGGQNENEVSRMKTATTGRASLI